MLHPEFLPPKKRKTDLIGLIALLVFALIATYFLHDKISPLFAGL